MTTSITPDDLDRFVARLKARLEVGARQYGDSSFRRPPGELLSEIQDELCDVAGWGLLLWVRIDRLRQRVERVDATGGAE